MANGFDFTDAIATVDRYVATGETPGAALAVAHGPEVVLEYYAGDAAPGRKAGPETLWPLASISKVYTAAAIVTMLERGELNLSMPASSVLPELTGPKGEITLRQLVTHTSGFPYESARMEERLTSKTPIDQILDEAYGEDLVFAPGAAQKYSDYAYGLAGRLAATVAGCSFPDLVRTRVLEPAGLANTFMPPPYSEEGRIADVRGSFGYGTDGSMYNSRYARDLAHPAFGTIATVTDLLRFGLLMAPNGGTGFFSEAGRMMMTTDQTGGDWAAEVAIPRTGIVHPWAVGPMLKGPTGSPDLVSPQSWGHPGASGCVFWTDPANDITMAFVSNSHILHNGIPSWLARLDAAINSTMACATRRAG